MQIWQIILLGYLGALIIWLVINAVFLLASFIIRHKVFMGLEAFAAVLAVLLGIATGIGDIALIIWLFNNNQIFWGIIAIVLGIGVVSFAGQLLSIPFALITSGFSAWYDTIAEE